MDRDSAEGTEKIYKECFSYMKVRTLMGNTTDGCDGCFMGTNRKKARKWYNYFRRPNLGSNKLISIGTAISNVV